MKKLLLLPFLLLFLTVGCSSDDDKAVVLQPLEALDIADIAYGSDPEQTMDVYLPEGRTEDTKVIILIHGGAWVEGDKDDFTATVPIIQAEFPDYAIVNINYRLATEASPAYPKQINDIEKVIDFLDKSDYAIGNDYAFIGASAGAHLAMLYSYKFDPNHNVKAVCDIVGPADFTDPAYLSHPLYPLAAQALIGTATPTIEQIAEVSPATHITALSPPTISFYGGQDPLVPASQGPRLKDKLDSFGVYNEFNFYPEGGHGDWDQATYIEVYAKMSDFLNNHFE
jgi:acetyl esterase/lipase